MDQSPVHIQTAQKATHFPTDSPSLAGFAAGVTLLPFSAARPISQLKAASSPKLHSHFFSTPQLKSQQSTMKWTRYPAASNDELWHKQTAAHLPLLLGKSYLLSCGRELRMAIVAVAAVKSTCPCKLESYVLSFTLPQERSCPQIGCFNSLGFTHSLHYKSLHLF